MLEFIKLEVLLRSDSESCNTLAFIKTYLRFYLANNVMFELLIYVALLIELATIFYAHDFNYQRGETKAN